jgi:hypothetical protein
MGYKKIFFSYRGNKRKIGKNAEIRGKFPLPEGELEAGV